MRMGVAVAIGTRNNNICGSARMPSSQQGNGRGGSQGDIAHPPLMSTF